MIMSKPRRHGKGEQVYIGAAQQWHTSRAALWRSMPQATRRYSPLRWRQAAWGGDSHLDAFASLASSGFLSLRTPATVNGIDPAPTPGPNCLFPHLLN